MSNRFENEQKNRAPSALQFPFQNSFNELDYL